MISLQLYISLLLYTLAAFLTTFSYGQMMWGYIDGGRTFNRDVWRPDSDYPWPGSRSEASKWQDTNGDLWMFGGYGFNIEDYPEYLNDLWRFNIDDKLWYVIKPKTESRPPIRAGASSCGVPGIMLTVYGGSTEEGSVLGDTWVYIIDSNTWLPVQSKSAPENRSEAATWCTHSHMFVFGGRNNQTVLADFWKFSLKNLTWTEIFSSVLTQLTQPQGRIGAFTWAFHKHGRNSLYMFGGEAPDGDLSLSVYSNEMWEYSLIYKNWSLQLVGDNPSDSLRSNNHTLLGRKSGVSWSDPNNDRIWLYGGEVILPYNHNKVFKGDVWAYNTQSSQWDWVCGEVTSEEQRKHGQHMVAGYHYTPGARAGALGWYYQNKFYMFGGKVHNEDQLKYANDLWYMTSPTTFKASAWIPILAIFLGLFLIAILVAVGLYSRRFTNHERSMSYSLVANSDMFDS